MKHVRIALAALMVVFLIGCGGKPSDMDSNTYDLGVKALEIMDSCNKMDISSEEADDKLEEIYDRLKSREFTESQSSEEIQNGLVTTYILSYRVGITSGDDLIQTADKLRKVLNKG